MRTALYLTLVCAMLVAGCGESATTSTSSTETADAAAPQKKLNSKEKVRVALKNIDGTVQDPVIKKVAFGEELSVYAKTPDGGAQGPSTGDLNRQAGDIFQAIYGPGAYKKTGAILVFKGGLVDTETGKSLNNANTGIFSISRRQARAIDWSDDDAVKYLIDWTNYRDFASPALKQDD